MDCEINTIKTLLEELKKEGRECLYDMSDADYKNNWKKQKIWNGVAERLGMQKSEVISLWKSIRKKFSNALAQAKGRSGDKRSVMRPMTTFLLKEMDFFRKFVDNSGSTVSSYQPESSSSSSFQNLFDETASDMEEVQYLCETSIELPQTPEVPKKRKKIDHFENEFKETMKALNEMSERLENSNDQDPFFLSLEKEFAKVPAERQSDLKLQLFSTVLSAQSN